MFHFKRLFRELSYDKLARLTLFFAVALLLVFFVDIASAFAGTLTVSDSSTGNSVAVRGQTHVADVLRLYASPPDTVTVTDVTVDTSGTALDSDISLVKLISDTNGNGAIDDGEPVLASTTTAGNVAQFTGLAIDISPDTTATLLVAFDISGFATLGRTIQSTLHYNVDPSLSDIKVDAASTVNPFPDLIGTLATIDSGGETLSVSQASVADTATAQGQGSVVQKLLLH
ncbi:MAG: hypothetical protein ACYC56_07605, partial [Candidatus Aquicultor sp.]